MNRLLWVSAFAFGLGVALPSHAENVDMTQVLLAEGGEPAKDPFDLTKDDPQCEKCKPLTMGLAIAHALVAQLPEERDMDPLQKWARGDLAAKIMSGKPVALTAEDITVIKRLVGKLYGAVLIRQIYPALDPAATPPAIK